MCSVSLRQRVFLVLRLCREVVSVEAVLKRGLTGQEEGDGGYKPLIW